MHGDAAIPRASGRHRHHRDGGAPEPRADRPGGLEIAGPEQQLGLGVADQRPGPHASVDLFDLAQHLHPQQDADAALPQRRQHLAQAGEVSEPPELIEVHADRASQPHPFRLLDEVVEQVGDEPGDQRLQARRLDFRHEDVQRRGLASDRGEVKVVGGRLDDQRVGPRGQPLQEAGHRRLPNAALARREDPLALTHLGDAARPQRLLNERRPLHREAVHRSDRVAALVPVLLHMQEQQRRQVPGRRRVDPRVAREITGRGVLHKQPCLPLRRADRVDAGQGIVADRAFEERAEQAGPSGVPAGGDVPERPGTGLHVKDDDAFPGGVSKKEVGGDGPGGLPRP